MTTGSREQILSALFTLGCGAYAWKNTPAGDQTQGIPSVRRLRLWGDVPLDQRPAFFQFEGGRGLYTWSTEATLKRTIRPQWFIYFNAKDPASVGASLINPVLDALDAALKPAGADIATGRQTLGNLCYHCRIDGDPFQDPGDLDGDGLVVIPINILMP